MTSSTSEKPAGNSRRLLLIGWDAADWNVIRPLLDKGELPALASLMERGTHGTLETLYPPLSPMLWTSIATGKQPYKHGIHGFTEPNPNGPGIRPISNLSRKTKAVWNMLQHHDLKSNVIGWWPSHPVEPTSGVMVSNHFHTATAKTPDAPWPISPGTIHPPELKEHLAKLRFHPGELSPEDILPFVPRAAEVDQEKDEHLGGLAKILAECTSIHAAATAVIQNEPWDFMSVYYDAIDHFSHLFMRFHPPRQDWIKEEDFELYKDVVAGAYRFHDMMLEAKLSLIDDDTTVMIISDHGFHPDHLRPAEIPSEPAGPATEHSPYGIFVMAGPEIAKGAKLNGASLLDITPTILQLFGLPVGEDMDGRVLEEVFLSQAPVESIPSWDEIEGECGLHTEEYVLDPDASHAALEQMVALGYIEDPGEEVNKVVEETRRELRYNLARSYMSGNRHIDAIPLLRECWDRWPEESRLGIQLIQCHLVLGQATEARDSLTQLISRKHDSATAAQEELKKVQAHWRKEKIDPLKIGRNESYRIKKLQSQVSINPYAAHMLEGQVSYLEEDYLKALTDFQKAQKHNPERPEVFIKIGQCLHKLDRDEEALGEFTKALQADELDPRAHLGICRSHLRLNHPSEAEASARLSLSSHFQNPWVHFYLGLALSQQQKHAEARDTLTEALGFNPNFPQALSALSQLYFGPLRDSQKAFSLLGREKVAQQQVEAVKAGRFQAGDSPVAPRTSQFQDLYNPPTQPIISNLSADLAPDEVITIVTGLPRSGTSLMMNMLKAAGLPILTDGQRVADDDNPKGYFEFTPATELRTNQDWIPEARGKVVKIVAQLLPFLPQGEKYQIIFMERPLEEIISSQEKMLNRTSAKTGDPDSLKTVYAQQIQKILARIETHEYPLLRVPFTHCIAQPTEYAHAIQEFLSREIPITEVATRVDASLYRNREKS